MKKNMFLTSTTAHHHHVIDSISTLNKKVSVQNTVFKNRVFEAEIKFFDSVLILEIQLIHYNTL